jgi:CRP-like cAMP-binding protein
METIEPILAAQPFFRGLEARHLKDLAACATKVNFESGQFLCRAEEEASRLYLLLSGRVSVEIFSARRGPMTLQALGPGDVMGWLWFDSKLYHWHMDARAVGLTRALSFEVGCLREKCEADHELGFEVMRRYAHSLAVRFRVISLQLTDMFKT